MHVRTVPTWIVLCGLMAATASAQPAFRVADLNTSVPQPPFANSFYDYPFEALGDVLVFVVDDKIHGAELWRTDGTVGGTQLVKDICPGSCSAKPRSLTLSNGLLFFAANDGAHGMELWKTDGTAAGTSMVADIYPGVDDGKIVTYKGMMDVGGVLFFVEDDGVHGESLWKTDGTPGGTQFVKDVSPEVLGPSARLLAASGNLLLLAVFDRSHGIEPWVSDGTADGTLMLGDLHPADFSSIQPSQPPEVGSIAAAAPQGGFLFAADDGEHGSELWFTDGTPEGTKLFKDIDPFGDSSPFGLTALNGLLYFGASGPEGYELWKTDGTAAGTVLVKDIRPVGDSTPLEITAAGNRLFFRADDGDHGAELWTSDGTAAGTHLVADLKTGTGDAFRLSSPNGFDFRYGLSAFGSDLIFLAEGLNGLQLWRTDGSTAGTVALSPPNLPESAILGVDSALTVAGRFYFRSGQSGLEIWKSDGTAAGTVQLKNFLTDTSAFFLYDEDGKVFFRDTFTALGSLLLFQASDGTGFEPWTSDGTPAGTSRIARLGPVPFGSSPRQMRALGNRAVFLTQNDDVWSTDGTAAGTQVLNPLGEHPFGKLVSSAGSVFFPSRHNTFGGDKLWKTDGTPAGTLEVADVSPARIGWNEITAAGGKVFFPVHFGDLWASDGTAAGTTSVATDLGNGGVLQNFTAAGGNVFFTAFSPTFFLEQALWKSDGTAAGTALVKDVRVGRNSLFQPNYHRFFAGTAGGPLFFAGDDRATGFELWKSDGSEAGTVRIADIFPGSRGSNPDWLTPLGSQVYFAADDGVHGRELWVSDGTEAGTHMVVDLLPGPGSSNPDNLTVVSNVLLFSAFDGIHGVEAWRTAGRVLGTRMLQDIAPGELPSSPTEFTAAGPNVYFAANDNTTGFELWAIPKSNVLATFGDVPTSFWAWRFIEGLAAAGVTSGCGGGDFCPAAQITRAETAVFLLLAEHGPGFVPPPATGIRFADVPADFWAGRWIEQLAAEGITSGCGGGNFCPAALLSRAQMAVQLLVAKHGSSFSPPPATGTRFTDVPADFWAGRWIEQLAAEGITSGCGGGNFCPDQPITRAEMAVFVAAAFGLPLP